MGAYAEFIGLEQVVTLVQSRNTPYYAVYISKDLKFECTADTVEEALVMLQEQLEVPQSNGTTVVYTIKFYSELTANGRIDKNSLCGTNTFRLFRMDMPAQYYHQREAGLPVVRALPQGDNGGALKTITERIQAIEDLLIEQAAQRAKEAAEAAAAEEEEEEQDGGIVGKIEYFAGLLNKPEVMNLIGMIGHLFKNGFQTINNTSMGNVNTVSPTTQEETTERITNAINVMFQYDANLVVHLEKLAQLAQTNTQQFNMLIGMLDKM